LAALNSEGVLLAKQGPLDPTSGSMPLLFTTKQHYAEVTPIRRRLLSALSGSPE
jgi:hypothetical protein